MTLQLGTDSDILYRSFVVRMSFISGDGLAKKDYSSLSIAKSISRGPSCGRSKFIRCPAPELYFYEPTEMSRRLPGLKTGVGILLTHQQRYARYWTFILLGVTARRLARAPGPTASRPRFLLLRLRIQWQGACTIYAACWSRSS